MGKSYLITGGVRSGKSSFALNLAKNYKKPFLIATGFAGDAEMFDRIEKHKQDRSLNWTTIEEQIDLSGTVLNVKTQGADFILVDCITMWLCNLMMRKFEHSVLVEELINIIKIIDDIPIVLVSNETGMGIVPQSKEGRDFRDIQGFANQKLAKCMDNVIFMVSGLPLYLKSSN